MIKLCRKKRNTSSIKLEQKIMNFAKKRICFCRGLLGLQMKVKYSRCSIYLLFKHFPAYDVMSPPEVNRESAGGDYGPGRYITDGATQTQPQYVNDEEVEREEETSF